MTTLDRALESGKEFDLYVTESRPRLIGHRTARELSTLDGVEVTLLVDGAAGHYVPQCDRILVGMNGIIDDTVYNRVGTYPVVATAAHEDVPGPSSGRRRSSSFAVSPSRMSSVRSEVMLEPAEGFEVGIRGTTRRRRGYSIRSPRRTA